MKQGRIKGISKYSAITVPALTGITVFNPEVYYCFRRLVSLGVESSFEDIVCPVLAQENRLFAINIPSESWIPANNLRGIEKANGLARRNNSSRVRLNKRQHSKYLQHIQVTLRTVQYS